ncbi:rhodanese-like domain-containing protein [Metamycoplasma hyosynoviae]|uniref:Rhodanese-like domain-containing protein n=1 Tax=Metamycoplasma hyosynoviae TaxID=29559 RepID=A0A9Q9BTQ0_9BACT|nr:rhodanese-like domain-containing protein [Metamycoplasma hyosynoviae]MDD1359005.1 rhodanese-like domain-containing protein [Metamycoplasma hyosynoviae]MDD1361703.1 rhodanese-like domain-containing protein [Metamycoplasma hyosynoviae]UTO26205.1 rhodanese-like domain-containing protein [Metamycoplasma hyosynoviae]UTO26886.1 rhodanese-like domain-containing protein [Metamycoplasma hyosynoviae]UTO27576.1 rhodanese-like domain-containing protein [Metamycoplasma hyosynoviae]
MKKSFPLILSSSCLLTISPLMLIAKKCEKEEKSFLLKLETHEAAELIQKENKNENFVLLDVRTQGEVAENYIEGSKNIDFNKKDFSEQLEKLDKNKKYLIYCRTENRSQKAAKLMKGLGFRYIYWMNGGITKWLKENRPVIYPQNKSSLMDLKISSVKNIYQLNENISIKIELKNLANESSTETPISSSYVLELKDESGNLLETNTLNAGNKIDLNLSETFNSIKSLDKDKSYILHISSNTNNELAYGTYIFQISSDIKQENSFEDYKNLGAFNHINNNPFEEVNQEFLKKHYGKNLLQYKVLTNKLEKKQLRELVDLKRKTIVIFASSTCLSCMESLIELSKFNLSNFNYLKIMTSIDEKNPNVSISETEVVFDEQKISDEKNTALYDGIDSIWLKRMDFKTTPKFVLLDEFGKIINVFENIQREMFGSKFNEIVEKTFCEKLQLKNNASNNPSNTNNTKPEEEPIFIEPNDKNRTFDQRKKLGQFNSISDHLELITKKLYGKNISDFHLLNSKNESKTIGEVIQHKNKPTVLIFGRTNCGYCVYALHHFKTLAQKNEYNVIDAIIPASDWKDFIEQEQLQDIQDKTLFRPIKSDEWNQIITHYHYVPQIFILDKNQNITFFLGSNWQGNYVSLMIEKVADTISVPITTTRAYN